MNDAPLHRSGAAEMSEGLATEEACGNWSEHEWTLSIIEGGVQITARPCGPSCKADLGDYAEWLEMGEVGVTVAMATDCPAYEVDDENVPTGPPRRMAGYEAGSHYIAHGSRCDCNWWPVVRILPACTE